MLLSDLEERFRRRGKRAAEFGAPTLTKVERDALQRAAHPRDIFAFQPVFLVMAFIIHAIIGAHRIIACIKR